MSSVHGSISLCVHLQVPSTFGSLNALGAVLEQRRSKDSSRSLLETSTDLQAPLADFIVTLISEITTDLLDTTHTVKRPLCSIADHAPRLRSRQAERRQWLSRNDLDELHGHPLSTAFNVDARKLRVADLDAVRLLSVTDDTHLLAVLLESHGVGGLVRDISESGRTAAGDVRLADLVALETLTQFLYLPAVERGENSRTTATAVTVASATSTAVVASTTATATAAIATAITVSATASTTAAASSSATTAKNLGSDLGELSTRKEGTESDVDVDDPSASGRPDGLEEALPDLSTFRDLNDGARVATIIEAPSACTVLLVLGSWLVLEEDIDGLDGRLDRVLLALVGVAGDIGGENAEVELRDLPQGDFEGRCPGGLAGTSWA